MTALTLDRNLERPDDFYEALLKAHEGLDDDAARALDARIILILANHIGRHEVLIEALAAAQAAAEKG